MLGLMTSIFFLLFVICLIWQGGVWKHRANNAEQELIKSQNQLTDLRKKIKKRNMVAVDLDLATTTQIFQELSRRGRMILLIPHQQNDTTFVETLASQMSPTQTMNVLRVAYSGIAGHLESSGDDEQTSE